MAKQRRVLFRARTPSRCCFLKFVFWPNLSMILESMVCSPFHHPIPLKTTHQNTPPTTSNQNWVMATCWFFWGEFSPPKIGGGKISPHFFSLFFSDGGLVNPMMGGLGVPARMRIASWRWWTYFISFFDEEMVLPLGGGNSNIFGMFTPIWGRCSISRAYFANGLKPPTGSCFFLARWCAA